MTEHEHTPEPANDEPEKDLREEPADQRQGEAPEDLLRRTTREQAEREQRLADES